MARVLAVLLLAALPAVAAEAADAPRVEPRGVFVGEAWRYRPSGPWPWVKGLVTRPFADLAAIPSGVAGWGGAEWLEVSALAAVTAAGTVDVQGRSGDARLQDALHAARGVNCANSPPGAPRCVAPAPSGFHLWTRPTNIVFVGVQVAVPLGLLIGGAAAGEGALLESSTLAIEAYSVAQLYHLALKVLSGREGVLWGDGAGSFHGPSLAYFPDGFPSGHAASLFALIGVYSTYFDRPWLHALLLGAGAVLAVGLVVDDYHFASEVLVGAAMGYLVGRWVVRHRSSRFVYDARGAPVRLMAVAPVVLAGGAGAAASFRF